MTALTITPALAALAPFVAAREAAAAEAMREACADYCHGRTTSRSFGSWADAFEAAERGIRALPLPAADALAARERAAFLRGMERAAGIVRTHAAAAKQCSEESDVIHRIRAEYLAKAFALVAAADDIEAAIRAAMEKEGGA